LILQRTRRDFLKATGLAAGTLIMPQFVHGRSKPSDKPNILVIMSDEHNASVLGCYGDDIILTPSLDGLARRGVTFDSCYCNSPLCVPSRLSFTSGKYASRVSAWNNDCWLPTADVSGDWNGDSMFRWLDEPGFKWKDLAVSEYYAHNISSGYAMIRNGRHKYVYHTPVDAGHPAGRELYDLKFDPSEFNNLAGEEKYKNLIDSLHEALIKEIGEHPDQIEQRCRAECAKGYGR